MSEKKQCFYKTLGIEKSATQAQVKKAYKKMAIKWHPDKNPDNKQQAKEKFREISEAYENLSNAQKRATYDKYGHEGPKFSQGPSGFSTNYTSQRFDFHDAENIFKHFFDENPFEDEFFSNIFGKKQNPKSNMPNSGFSGFSSFGMGGMGGMGTGIKKGPGLMRANSMFQHEDFFNSGFGGKSLFSSFNDPLDSHPGLSKVISTSTTTVNGKTVTTKKTTINNPDGTKDVTEEVIEGKSSKMKKKYSLGPGQSIQN